MPYDKDGKYYRQPTNSVNKDKKPSETTSNKPKSKSVGSTSSYKQKETAGYIVIGVFLVAIIGGCAAFLNQEYEPKRNPNLEGSVQDFDVCVKKQKRAGLSTDKCWDMLWRWLVERH